MSTIDPASTPTGRLGLSAFAEAARQDDGARLVVAGESLRVLGTGTTPAGRNVAWVAPDDRTVALFTNALAEAYGNGIAGAVSRELGLARNGTLSAATVNRAIDMAETSRQALEGIDFALRLSCLAGTNSEAFRAACTEADVIPDHLDSSRRDAIDDAMRLRFEQSQQAGASPVSPDTARAWLVELIKAQEPSE